MGTTIDKLNKVQETKAAIKQAIIDKGVDVSDDTIFADYPTKIAAIESGSSETYVNPDFYEIRTNGGTDCSYLFYFYSGAELDLSSLDTSNATTMYRIFQYCTNLTTLDLSSFDTSNVTDMGEMFYQCNKLTTIDLSSFDTSNVTTMSYMFYSCYKLTSLDLSSFDTSKVTSMGRMFYYCKALTTIDLSSFDTSNVTDMTYMFYGLPIDSLDLSSWDTSNVTNMGNMFFGCANLTTLNISSWDTSNVTNMSGMFGNCPNLITIIGELDLTKSNQSHSSTFQNCTSLETVYLKNIYKNCTMTNNSKWSINLGATIVKDECLIYIIDQLPDLINDKGLTDTSNIILTLPTTNTLTEEQVQVAIDKGWSVANTTY